MVTKARTILLFLITVSVMATTGLWFVNTRKPVSLVEIALFTGIGLIILLSIYIGFKRITNERVGLPADDELSIRVREKAAASAFIFSVLMWTFAGYYAIDKGIEGRLVLGGGILGMAILFFGFWIYYSRVGTGAGHE